jgi:hypothetical protein
VLDYKPTITVKEARKILGSEASSLTDEAILELIQSIERLTDYIWDDLTVPKTGMVESAVCSPQRQ